MRRLLPLLLTGLLLASGATANAAPPGAADDAGLAVTGYALAGVRPSVLDREKSALTTVGIDGVTVAKDGASVSSPTAQAKATAVQAHDLGKRAELLVSNFSGDDFSPAVGHRLLSSDTHRAAVTDALAAQVASGAFDGIAVDLESLRAEDKDGLTAFVKTLREKLPDASISIALMASTTKEGYADLGYDLSGLADVVDVMALMAYDQHGPWSGPGAIGSLVWQKKALSALLHDVPAAKVDLGVAGYGYTWPRKGTGHPISPSSARAAVTKAHTHATWHKDSGEWSVTLPSGTRIWWSDRRSWDLRVTMAEDQHLHGLALWRLGLADSIA